MTDLPAEMVQAAAEALRKRMIVDDLWGMPIEEVDRESDAEAALRAAFAKLPECEAAVRAMDDAMTFYVMDHGVPAPGRERLRMVKQALAALTREFGDQE